MVWDPVTRASLAAFDLGEVTGEPTLVARGAQGLIWKVSTATATYAVKHLQPWVDAPPVPFDIAVQQAADGAGIPMPAPVLTPDGRAVVDRVRVYEWVDLAPALHAPVSDAQAREAGDLLGRIHHLGIAPAGEPSSWFLSPPSRNAWEDVVSDARATGVDSPWIDAVAADIGFLVEVGERYTVALSGSLITCHLDFNLTNVLPALVDDRLVVLDWENAGPFVADAELAEVLVDWTSAPDGTVDMDAVHSMLVAYGREVTITRQSFAMEVVTSLNYLRVQIDNLVYDFEGKDASFAESTLPMLVPDALRGRLRAIDHLVRALTSEA